MKWIKILIISTFIQKFMKIPVEVSARHIHLSKEVLEAVFGANYSLHNLKELSQPGQFACEEKVDITGPRGTIKGVRVLGPVRPKTQIEISLTDAKKIGIPGVVRESGDLSGTPGCIVSGPNGSYDLKEGLIIAKRHIHMTPEDAEKMKVTDGSIGTVKIKSDVRSLIYDDVIMRVSDKFNLAMHIDTDEANALNHSPGTEGEVILQSVNTKK